MGGDRLADAFQGKDIGGGPHVDILFLLHLPDQGGLGSQELAQFRMHLLDRPVITGAVLGPFEIGDHDAAGIGQDVGNDEDVPGVQHIVGKGRHRSVGQLQDDFRLDLLGVLGGDLVFQGGRDQQFAFAFQQFGVGDFTAGPEGRGAGNELGFGLVYHDLVRVHAVGIMDRRLGIRDSDDAEAVLVQQPGARVRGIAESLEDDPGFSRDHPQFLFEMAEDDVPAPSGGVVAAERAAEHDRLAGDHRRRGMADDVGVFVGHPPHHRGVGIDIGGGNVPVGTDEVVKRADVGAAQPFQFEVREPLGVHRHSALGAAERQVDDGAFEGHPKSQGHHLVQGDAGVVADSPLGGAAGVVVTAAPGVERLQGAVVHAHHEAGVQGLLRGFQFFHNVRVDGDELGRRFEAFAGL